MQFQEVEIFIGPDGKVSYEVRGVKGRQCLDLTRELEADLGGAIVSREETWEMNQEEVAEQIDRRLSNRD
jgi:hypothetical protein